MYTLGWALVALMGFAHITCRAEEATTNAFALAMHATLVPEIHIRPPEGTGPQVPFGSITGVVCSVQATVSNQNSFAIHARNLTMLELVDLICFLSDTTYAFGKGGLIVAPTNMLTVCLQQNAKREKALIAKLKSTKCPGIVLRPPATIIDAFDFMYQVSVDYDDQERLLERRGINFAIKRPPQLAVKEEPKSNVPSMCDLGQPFRTLYDALTNVCEKVNARFTVRDNTVVIYPAVEANAPSGSGRTKTRNAESVGEMLGHQTIVPK